MSAPQLQLHTLRLENVFSYREATVAFEPGVSVFAGDNGAGKSSLLEAVFFALFASDTRTITNKSLAEVLREGERLASLALTFSLGGDDYEVALALRRTAERVAAHSAKCTLSRGGEQMATGVQDVIQQIQALLKMDSDDFANCLYVRQGEVDRLINARPQDRQRTIDRLLRLTKVDDYERRLKTAITSINRRKDQLQGAQEKTEGDASALVALALPAQKLRLEKDMAALEVEQQQLRNELDATDEDARQLSGALARHEKTLKEMEGLRAQYRQARNEFDQLQNDLKTLDQRQVELAAQADPLDARWAEIKRGIDWDQLGVAPEQDLLPTLEALQRAQNRRQQAIQALREGLAETRTQRKGAEAQRDEQRQQLSAQEQASAKLRHQTTALEAEIAEKLQDLEISAPPLAQLDVARLLEENEIRRRELQTRQRQLDTARATERAAQTQLQDAINQSQSLIESGRCPTCQQPVRAENLADHLAHLNSRLKAVGETLVELDAQAATLATDDEALQGAQRALRALQDDHRRWTQLGRQLQESEAQRAGVQQKIESLNEALSRLQETEALKLIEGTTVKQEIEANESHLRALERARDVRAQLAQNQREQETTRQRRSDRAQLADQSRVRMSELEARYNERRDAIGGQAAEQLEAQLARCLKTREEQTQGLEADQRRRDELANELGQVRSRLDQLKKAQDALKEIAAKLAAVAALLAEAQRLQAVYQEVKRAQRRKNFDALNRIFNEYFRLMNPGLAYEGVRLTEGFDIEIVRNNDAVMAPGLLSGGERALVNLALRAALHQVICEAGGVLLPLFFDEPTVYLDVHHVQRLERLFEALGRRVGQIVVVSHEATLVEGADHEYRVSKDADNLSRVEQLR